VMGGTPFSEAGPVVSAVLTQSHFGIAWSVGCAGAVLACFGGARRGRTAGWVATAGMIVYVAGKAAASHAADAGDFTLREGIHVLHLSATALWAGSVIVAAPVLWRWNSNAAVSTEATTVASAGPANRVAFCAQLSHLATVALAVVIVTGIYNATQDTAHLTVPLLGVLYGRVLALKLVLVTLAVLLGGYNRMIYLPRLQHTAADGGPAYRDAQRSFDRLLAVEAVAMVDKRGGCASIGIMHQHAGASVHHPVANVCAEVVAMRLCMTSTAPLSTSRDQRDRFHPLVERAIHRMRFEQLPRACQQFIKP
jgi:putative copper resistance protein D